MEAVRLFILRKKTHKEHIQIYTNTQIIFLLESLYNYLYLGLLLQDANCVFILLECTEKKICFTKENSQSSPQIISSNIVITGLVNLSHQI